MWLMSRKCALQRNSCWGSASAWWDTFNAMQQPDHRVTWQEFIVAFREFYIPAGVLNRKLMEFLDLRQGSMSVIDYVNKLNHSSQYARTHVDIDEKKRDRFCRSLSYSLQKELYTGNYQTFGAMMNAAIAMEGLRVTLRQNGSTIRWLLGLLATPRHKKYILLGGCPINLWVGIHFDNLSRLFRHLPLSIVDLLSRCNISSPRDSRSHLIKDWGTSLVLVSNVARKATMPGSVRKTSPFSLLSPQLTPT